jgi:EmrB/QacA subfamily drug resistance transporter
MSDIAVKQPSMNPLFVLLTASTGCAMTVLDTNVVAILLPAVARDFQASFAEIEWVISTYVLCFASLLLPAGAIADRFGRRRVFLVGIVSFAISSVLCGVAASAMALYLARAIQGATAAFLLAPALAIIGHTFHNEAERNRAWAIWGAMMGLTMVLAPIIGGMIAYAAGWRWAFHFNAPICALLATAAVFFVVESSDAAARRLDPAGIVSFTTAMFGMTWGLINGQAHGWGSTRSLFGFMGGALAFVIFIAAERSRERPMLDLRLFANRRFVGAVWAMFAYAAAAQVMASMLPLFLQNGLGLAPLEAGFAMLPFALAMLIFPQVGRMLGHRFSSKTILAAGLVLVGFGNALAAFGAQLGNRPIIMMGMLVLGSGGGLLNGETQKAIMSVVPRERAGMASGISTTSRFSGILLGFAVLSGVLATAVRNRLVNPGSQTNCAPASSFADAVVAGDLPHAVSGLTGTTRLLAIEQARAAFSSGFSLALLTAAMFALLSSFAIYRLMRPR